MPGIVAEEARGELEYLSDALGGPLGVSAPGVAPPGRFTDNLGYFLREPAGPENVESALGLASLSPGLSGIGFGAGGSGSLADAVRSQRFASHFPSEWSRNTAMTEFLRQFGGDFGSADIDAYLASVPRREREVGSRFSALGSILDALSGDGISVTGGADFVDSLSARLSGFLDVGGAGIGIDPSAGASRLSDLYSRVAESVAGTFSDVRSAVAERFRSGSASGAAEEVERVVDPRTGEIYEGGVPEGFVLGPGRIGLVPEHARPIYTEPIPEGRERLYDRFGRPTEVSESRVPYLTSEQRGSYRFYFSPDDSPEGGFLLGPGYRRQFAGAGGGQAGTGSGGDFGGGGGGGGWGGSDGTGYLGVGLSGSGQLSLSGGLYDLANNPFVSGAIGGAVATQFGVIQPSLSAAQRSRLLAQRVGRLRGLDQGERERLIERIHEISGGAAEVPPEILAESLQAFRTDAGIEYYESALADIARVRETSGAEPFGIARVLDYGSGRSLADDPYSDRLLDIVSGLPPRAVQALSEEEALQALAGSGVDPIEYYALASAVAASNEEEIHQFVAGFRELTSAYPRQYFEAEGNRGRFAEIYQRFGRTQPRDAASRQIAENIQEYGLRADVETILERAGQPGSFGRRASSVDALDPLYDVSVASAGVDEQSQEYGENQNAFSSFLLNRLSDAFRLTEPVHGLLGPAFSLAGVGVGSGLLGLGASWLAGRYGVGGAASRVGGAARGVGGAALGAGRWGLGLAGGSLAAAGTLLAIPGSNNQSEEFQAYLRAQRGLTEAAEDLSSAAAALSQSAEDVSEAADDGRNFRLRPGYTVHQAGGYGDATLNRVVDADTIRFGRGGQEWPLRIEGLDAPEAGTTEGDRLSRLLSEEIGEGSGIGVRVTGLDTYDRFVGEVTEEGSDYVNLRTRLIAEGRGQYDSTWLSRRGDPALDAAAFDFAEGRSGLLPSPSQAPIIVVHINGVSIQGDRGRRLGEAVLDIVYEDTELSGSANNVVINTDTGALVGFGS